MADIETIRKNIRAAVEDYLSAPEAWEDAMLSVNPETGKVELIELEEAETLPSDIDEYDIMEFIEMTPDGKWKVDEEAISLV